MENQKYTIIKVVSYSNTVEEHRLLDTGEITVVKKLHTTLTAKHYLEEMTND